MDEKSETGQKISVMFARKRPGNSRRVSALADAVGDKSWVVRAAALEALAERGDPSVLDTVKLYMSDEKGDVKYAAAAARSAAQCYQGIWGSC